jgi:predicted Holliday junction resolvase-like endonuclease
MTAEVDLIKNITPNSIKECILILVIIALIYYIYINNEELFELKKENDLYETHLKKIINGDNSDFENVKKYFNNVDNNIKYKKEIDNFKNKKKYINKDAF